MSRALPITQREAQALLRAAEAEKGIVEVKIGDKVVRLIPASLAHFDKSMDKSEDDDLDAELAAFEAKHGDN